MRGVVCARVMRGRLFLFLQRLDEARYARYARCCTSTHDAVPHSTRPINAISLESRPENDNHARARRWLAVQQWSSGPVAQRSSGPMFQCSSVSKGRSKGSEWLPASTSGYRVSGVPLCRAQGALEDGMDGETLVDGMDGLVSGGRGGGQHGGSWHLHHVRTVL